MGTVPAGGAEDDAAPASRPRGRPRDPALENRAREAALDVFGERGLAGLTLDEVALRAKVGKSSLYLRWPDKESLLADALGRVQEEAGDALPDTAPAGEETPDDAEPRSLRDYLLAHVHRRAALYLSKYGLAMLRLYAEARAHPELFDHIREQAISRFVLAERERVAAAIRAGILPSDASPVRILDAVEGAIFMHLLVTPPTLMGRVRAGLDEYIERMVDDQLRAAGYDAQADAATRS